MCNLASKRISRHKMKSANKHFYFYNSKRIFLFFFAIVFYASSVSAQEIALLDSLTLDTLTPITTLEEALKHPEQVVKLVLRKKKLKTFPAEILQFTNLQYLDLSKNNIRELPADISKLNAIASAHNN